MRIRLSDEAITRQTHIVMDFFTLVGLSACLYFLIYAVCLWFFDCDLHLAYCEKFGKKLGQSAKLRGKVIWITEASTELGRWMAVRAAREQGKLVLSSNSPTKLKKIKATCLKANCFLRSKDILILKFEVGEVHTHREIFRMILKHFGKLDIIILNEDKWERGVWEDACPPTDHRLFQSNLFGVLALSRLVVKYFVWRQKGKLAVTSSIAGLIGVPYSGCYTGTKHALHGYFDSLRFEKIGENIQATLLCLGSSDLSREKEDDKLSNDVRPKKKMTGERCAHLCLTAIVNELDEVWMAVFPILPLIYAIKYFPNVTKFMLKYLKRQFTLTISYLWYEQQTLFW